MSKIVIRNILALTKVKNGLSNYFAETIVYHCYYIYHMKILSHIIIWHLYKGVIRMFHEFYESLLLSLEYTIFISTIFQSFLRSCKPRNVSIFNLMLFYQTFSLTMASFRFPGKGKNRNEGGGGSGLHCSCSRGNVYTTS